MWYSRYANGTTKRLPSAVYTAKFPFYGLDLPIIVKSLAESFLVNMILLLPMAATLLAMFTSFLGSPSFTLFRLKEALQLRGDLGLDLGFPMK
ncbi:hypothetical protein AAC387_Pa10g1014 [Persea americana]